MGALADRVAVQATFDELGTPLHEVTFVVVDLETTGGSPQACEITEIGAVKVRGGQVLGEFQTLVDPGVPIPPFISVLTGITDAMVAGAPRLGAALPAFLEFAGGTVGTVLVAHNAPFDMAFLKAACALTAHEWPGHQVLDTARLARHVVTRDEAPNCKLSSLARLFRAGTTPDHRALSDARATVDVLHGMLERLGNLGVRSLEELATFSSRVSPEQRRKRHLAEGLPHAPGVYVFADAARRGALRRQVPQPAQPGPHLLHGLGDPQPDGRDGRPGHVGHPHRLCDAAGGRGPRAAADRRPQAALQPSVTLSRARVVAQAHGRAVPAAVHSA